jgi:serine/threonine-protein kinase
MGALGPVFRCQGRAAAGQQGAGQPGGQLVAVKAFKLDVSPELAPSIADALRALVKNAPAHGGLVALVEAGLDGSTPWLAMEHVPHPTLDTRLREGGLLPLDEAIGIVRALAAAVDAAHAHGLSHGSLHPRDIFLHPDGAVSVSGFGVAAALGVAGLRPPRRRPFTAPETLAQKPLGPAADRYALGVMAYEIVSGRRLLGAGDDLVAGLEARAATSDVVRASTALAAMLAERPDHRPSSAGAFAKALGAALEAPPPEGAPTVATAVTQLASSPAPPASAPLPAVLMPQAGARPPRASDDAPPPEALEEFARQGTFWERPRHDEAPDAATVAIGAVSPAGAGIDPHPAAAPEPLEALRRAAPPVEVDPLLRLDPPEPAASGPDAGAPDTLLFSTFGAAGDRAPSADPALAEPASHTPPLVVLALTLGLGLAIGAAGGYLVGVRSGERAAQHALGGVTTELPGTFPGEPAAGPPAGAIAEPAAPSNAGRTPATGNAGGATSPAAAPGPSAPPASASATAAAAAPSRPPEPRHPAPAAVGQLIVHSSPAKAGVLIDGSWRGRTPLTIKGLTVGTHAVRVVEDGYIAETRRVAVDARAAGTTVSFQLSKVRGPERPSAAAARPGVTTGRLLLESRPSGAAVLIDGRVVGTTPLLLSDLEPGTRQVRIELPGHKPWTTTASVVAGQRVRVAASLEEIIDR